MSGSSAIFIRFLVTKFENCNNVEEHKLVHTGVDETNIDLPTHWELWAAPVYSVVVSSGQTEQEIIPDNSWYCPLGHIEQRLFTLSW